MSLWYIFIEWKDNEQALTWHGLKLMDIQDIIDYIDQELGRWGSYSGIFRPAKGIW